MPKLCLQPIDFDEACAFVRQCHRHHLPPQGWKWGIAVNDGAKIVGVVTMRRPVARHLDNGWTAAVTRCCTDGTPHVASMLYAAAWRAARAKGYRSLITYTLVTEPGTSVKAAGYTCLYQVQGQSWHRPSRPRVDTHPI